jgi:hypothetical protein
MFVCTVVTIHLIIYECIVGDNLILYESMNALMEICARIFHVCVHCGDYTLNYL